MSNKVRLETNLYVRPPEEHTSSQFRKENKKKINDLDSVVSETETLSLTRVDSEPLLIEGSQTIQTPKTPKLENGPSTQGHKDKDWR